MKYSVRVFWEKGLEEDFTNNTYSRLHQWSFDGGVHIKASSSPQVVPVPMSDASAVDPEEAFVAALSSCHMLFFLSIAARENYVVDTYEDHAEGIMGKNDRGELAMTSITLKPRITFSSQHEIQLNEIQELHRKAHMRCFLAKSIKAEINIIADKS